MKIVVDANVFFSAFIRKNSVVRQIILDPHLELFSPEWLLEEFDKNQDEILKKMDNKENFLETKELLLSFIKIIPKEMYESYIEIAERALKENKKDIPYVSLCLYLNVPLWSNDANLKKKQKLVKVLTISEMIDTFVKEV